jgi:hypothetical protein
MENENKLPETETIGKSILPIHKFERAFIRDEVDEEIKILQKLLYKEALYTGEINGINDLQTRDALYAFQLKYQILKPSDAYNLRGYFGPGTRYKANILMPK